MEETATRGREPIGFSHFTHAQISGCPSPARPVQPDQSSPSQSRVWENLGSQAHPQICEIRGMVVSPSSSAWMRMRPNCQIYGLGPDGLSSEVNMFSCRHQPLSFLPAEANPPEEELRRPCCDGKRDSGRVNAGKAAGISQPSSSTVSRRGCQSQADSTVPDKSTRDVFRAPWPRGRRSTSVAQDNKYQRVSLASSDPVSSV